jgi:hypothetical protein
LVCLYEEGLYYVKRSLLLFLRLITGKDMCLNVKVLKRKPSRHCKEANSKLIQKTDTWQNFLELMGAKTQLGPMEPKDPNAATRQATGSPSTAAESTPIISISCAI